MSAFGDLNAVREISQDSTVTMSSVAKLTLNENHIIRRYQDSYLVARTANSFGNIAKLAGFVAAGIVAFIGLLLTFITVGSFRDFGVAFVVFLIALTLGAVIGSIFYVFGILLSALGQNLLAALDSAVHSSPFISNEQKAQAMGLGK